MGEKDISEKVLEAYNDVFCDIVNVLLFDGDEVLHPESLEDALPRSTYKVDGKLHEMERDVAKYCREGNIRISCIGLENQTISDKDMPLRVIGYDGIAYRDQLNKKNRSKESGELVPDPNRFPVVTLVLYFGYEKRWDKPVNLLNCFEIPDRFQPYVNDYRINLYEIAWLPDETIRKFKSDFRIVADYFSQMRKNGDYVPVKQEFVHVQEILQMLSVFAKDDRFAEANHTEKGEVKNMCEFLDRIEEAGIKKGMAQGVAQEQERSIRSLVSMTHKCGGSFDDVVDEIMGSYGFSKEEAAEKVNLYW